MPNAARRLISYAVALALLASMPAMVSIARDANGTANAAVKRQLQQVVDAYVAKRADAEGNSGVSLRVDVGTRHPVTAVFSGTDGLPDGTPIGPDTLFRIGSNTKHFTSALILLLEARGKLDINQTIGHWLPQYPAWKDVSIRSLLNMTSPIPNYSETVEIGQLQAADIHYQFTPEQLVAAVDPDQGRHLPSASGWFYSNTNDILAGMIIEAASGLSYKQALEELILKPLGLHDTFYSDGPYPPEVLKRVPRRPLFESSLPRLSAGALHPVHFGTAGRARHAHTESVLGWSGRRHDFDTARSRSLDSGPLRLAPLSAEAA